MKYNEVESIPLEASDKAAYLAQQEHENKARQNHKLKALSKVYKNKSGLSKKQQAFVGSLKKNDYRAFKKHNTTTNTGSSKIRKEEPLNSESHPTFSAAAPGNIEPSQRKEVLSGEELSSTYQLASGNPYSHSKHGASSGS